MFAQSLIDYGTLHALADAIGVWQHTLRVWWHAVPTISWVAFACAGLLVLALRKLPTQPTRLVDERDAGMGILDALKQLVGRRQEPEPEAPAPTPRAVRLLPVTPEARFALGGVEAVPLRDFPFRIGRECRASQSMVADPARLLSKTERRRHLGQLNDLYLRESPQVPTVQRISREHCAIDRADDKFVVVDRGSTSGTVVQTSPAGPDHPAGQVFISIAKALRQQLL